MLLIIISFLLWYIVGLLCCAYLTIKDVDTIGWGCTPRETVVLHVVSAFFGPLTLMILR